MQTFKTFLKIAKTRLPHSILYFVIFTVLMCLMSVVTKDSSSSQFQSSSLDIAIIDEDQSDSSKALTEYLDSMHTLVPLENDKETIQDSLFYHKVSYVLTIPKGFGDRLVTGDSKNLIQSTKRKDSARGFFVDEQINQYLKTVQLYLTSGYSKFDAIQKTKASLNNSDEVTTVSFDKTQHTSNTIMFYYFQYIPYILLLLMIIGLSPILITFRKKDLEDRINCSSLRQSSKNLQLSTGCAFYCLTIWILFIVIAAFAFGSDLFSRSGLLCILNSFVFLLISAAITLLISTFSPNNNILNMIANVVGLGMSFLCGIFVPQWMLADSLIRVARFLPAYWYVRITDMVSGFSGAAFSMKTYWECLGIQVVFFVAIFALYLIADKQKKQGRIITTKVS